MNNKLQAGVATAYPLVGENFTVTRRIRGDSLVDFPPADGEVCRLGPDPDDNQTNPLRIFVGWTDILMKDRSAIVEISAMSQHDHPDPLASSPVQNGAHAHCDNDPGDLSCL